MKLHHLIPAGEDANADDIDLPAPGRIHPARLRFGRTTNPHVPTVEFRRTAGPDRPERRRLY